MSVNIARPAGRFLIAFTVLTLIAMPFFGIAFMPVEFTPLQIAHPPFIVIKAENTTYIVGTSDAERTLEVLAKIQQRLESPLQ